MYRKVYLYLPLCLRLECGGRKGRKGGKLTISSERTNVADMMASTALAIVVAR